VGFLEHPKCLADAGGKAEVELELAPFGPRHELDEVFGMRTVLVGLGHPPDDTVRLMKRAVILKLGGRLDGKPAVSSMVSSVVSARSIDER
jgi:hypothetical protein